MMKVFSVVGSGHYGGGMAIVIARDEARAKVIAGTIKDEMWNTDYRNSNQVQELHELATDEDEMVVDHFEIGE